MAPSAPFLDEDNTSNIAANTEYGIQTNGVVSSDGALKDNTKKSNRKTKRSSGADEPIPPEPNSYAEAVKEDPADVERREAEQIPPEPTSYAEAVKEDPADVERREAEEAHKEAEDNSTRKTNKKSGKNSEKSSSKNMQEKSSKHTLAGDVTFAEALKEGSSQKGNSKERGLNTEQSPPVSSQASTAVDYPDIHSDAGEEYAAERQRDKARAPEVLGTRWAPLQVPVKRRLQTAAVLVHSLCIGLSLSIFFAFCANPLFWPIIIIYLVSMLFATDARDGKLRKRKEWVRKLPIWKYFADYFPARLHKTHDLQPTRKYIFGYHPHGIISHGAWAAFGTDALGFSEKFPGITNSLCTLDSNFNLPLYREYVMSMGLSSVSKESIKNVLTRGGPNNEGMGRAVTIVVGGARESLEAQPNTMRLIIKERKGFIKIAMQTGADLVPVVAFGENDLYDQLDPHKHPWLHGMQRYFLKAWKFTLPLLHGRGIFNYDVGLMPYRRPMNIVVGKPISVMQSANPDNSEVNRLHDLYTEELQRIWERYKDEFATHRKEDIQFLA